MAGSEQDRTHEVAVRIREATAMDAASIGRIHVETWRASYAGLVPEDYLVRLSMRDRASWWREGIGRGREGHVLVAELEGSGRIVGFGSCGRARGQGRGPTGEVYTLYVDLDWQDRGVGRKLLAALFEELAAQGHSSAIVWVLADNPSRFFYEAMGGQALGEGKERFAGALLDTLAYGWLDLQGWLAQMKRPDLD